MSEPATSSRTPKLRALTPFLWVGLGLLFGVAGSRAFFDRPTPATKGVVATPTLQKPIPGATPEAPEEIPPVDPMEGIEILPADQPFGIGKAALRGPLSQVPVPEAPRPAEPIPQPDISSPAPKRIKRPIDRIVELGLPEPPKPAEPKPPTTNPAPAVPLADRLAQFVAFAQNELKGETQITPDGPETTFVDVTLATSDATRLRAKAEDLGGRLLSQSTPGEDAVRAAEARLASLRQWRQKLLETLDPQSRPITEADRDIASAEKTWDDAKNAVQRDRATLQFRFRG